MAEEAAKAKRVAEEAARAAQKAATEKLAAKEAATAKQVAEEAAKAKRAAEEAATAKRVADEAATAKQAAEAAAAAAEAAAKQRRRNPGRYSAQELMRAKYGDNLPEYKPPPGADDETMGLYGEAAGSSAAPAPLEDDGGASAWLRTPTDDCSSARSSSLRASVVPSMPKRASSIGK